MNVLKYFINRSHLEEKSDVVQHKRCINILRETPVVGDPLKKLYYLFPSGLSALDSLVCALCFVLCVVCATALGSPLLQLCPAWSDANTEKIQNLIMTLIDICSPCHPGRHTCFRQQFWRLCQRRDPNINSSLSWFLQGALWSKQVLHLNPPAAVTATSPVFSPYNVSMALTSSSSKINGLLTLNGFTNGDMTEFQTLEWARPSECPIWWTRVWKKENN